MKRILTTAALCVALTAGSASAWPVFGSTGNWSNAIDKVGVGKVSVSKAATVIGGTFVAWTVYRFFQNCGPFRCNS